MSGDSNDPRDTVPVHPEGLPTMRMQPDPKSIPPGDAGDGRVWSGSHDSGAFGRFTILDIVGAGGMGVVLAAHDPELDRKVAIKVLRTRGLTGEKRKREAARLLREARTIAQLSHPHVVTVFEAGTIDDRVFIAMEYVEGQTLREWLGERARQVDEIVDAFVKAGRGLAAGHKAGVVHRDFKPDNVLIGRDGRVRVIDFGLARPAGGGETGETPPPSNELLDKQSTASFGTPVYMAPEQHSRDEVGPAADQFAFAVAMYEALYSRLPFAGTTYGELVVNVTSGALRAPEGRTDVPAHVHAAIVRGLAVQPGERFESMDALLARLAPPEIPPGASAYGLRIEQKRGLGWGLGLAIAVGAGATVATILAFVLARGGKDEPAPVVDPCAGGEERFADVWNADVLAKVQQAFTASQRGGARDQAQLVDVALKKYIASWVVQRRRLCESHEKRDRSAESYDLGMRCLGEGVARTKALAGMLSTMPDKQVVDHAVVAVDSLPDPVACTTLLPREEMPRPAGIDAQLDMLDPGIAEVEAAIDAGKGELAAEWADKLIDKAKPLGYPKLDARLHLLKGKAFAKALEGVKAEPELREAIRLAALAKDDLVTAQAWTVLVDVVGFQEARYEDAVALEPVAEAAIQRADGGPVLEADLAYAMGATHVQKGDYKHAIGAFEKAVALREKALGPDHPEVAMARNSLGGALLRTGNLDRAKVELEKALAIREAAMGARHPDLALTLANLGALAQMQGNLVASTRYAQRALTLLEEIHGPDHVNVGLTLINLAGLEQAAKDNKSALRDFTRALGIFEKLGKDHVYVAFALTGLAECKVATKDTVGAIADAERAIAIFEAHQGDPAQLGEARFALATALWERNADGDQARARKLAKDASAAFPDAAAWLKTH